MTDPVDRTAQIQGCLDRLKHGDDSARGELLAHACDRLGRLARKLLSGDRRIRRWDQTDDVRQDAMIRLYQSLGRARPETVLDFFRLAAFHIRRTLIDRARHHFGPEGDGAHHATDGLRGVVEAGETTHDPQRLAHWTDLHRAIAALPDDERDAFELLWYHELPQAEAAALLGISERTL